jgi:dTDP-4-amino-4,6-dideoxygalactose transaminase
VNSGRPSPARIEFFKHDLGKPELESIARVLSGRILTTGETVRTFEEQFAAYLGRRHALAVTSCTGALHMSLLALGVGPGDEVITTPMTFIATSTAIIEAGATPVFVDVEPATGNLDASRIHAAITPRTKAILPVHLYGQMCDMRAIHELAKRHHLCVVEDAAHCVEGARDGIRPGELSDAACFSFYATKNLTCGEGGAVVTDDAALFEKLRLLRLHGMTKNAADRQREGYKHWDMVSFGWKYNLDNIHAAILLPQLQRLDTTWQRREVLARRYENELADLPGVQVPTPIPGVRHARHLMVAWVGDGRRDEVIAALQASGVEVMVNYRAIHLLTYFRERFGYSGGEFPVAERIGESTISLPFYPGMPDEHVNEVAERFRQAMLMRCS